MTSAVNWKEGNRRITLADGRLDGMVVRRLKQAGRREPWLDVPSKILAIGVSAKRPKSHSSVDVVSSGAYRVAGQPVSASGEFAASIAVLS